MGARVTAEHQEKLLLLGLQTAHLIHDWNNVLTLLQAQCAELPPSEAASNLAASLAEATALPRQLLRYLRPDKEPHALVVLDNWLRFAKREFGQLLGARIRLRLHDGAPGVAILVDPHQLRNALLNLVMNARAAMEESGEIILATSVEASAVVLRVSDNGRGMDESVRSRLFEPFFSTGTDSQRTGLGLSSVKAFLEAHRGTIAVASVPGEGTTFTLRFPAAA